MELGDISNLFHVESEKLYSLFNNASESDLSLPKIVELYYQVMNVSSMINMIEQQSDAIEKSLKSEINETKTTISEKFDSTLHLKILASLSSQIENDMKHLQSNANIKKTKDEIEKEAQLYENLRKKMSTREFVEQYDKGHK